MLAQVYTYPKWSAVLRYFGAKPPYSPAKERLLREATRFSDTAESAAHLALKDFVAANPHLLGIKAKVIETLVEHRLPSGDEIDVLFQLRDGCVAAEVKSQTSSDGDLARGVFQCVKYEALLNAVAKYDGKQMDVSAFLVLGGALPLEIRELANVLGVSVVPNVMPSISAPVA